MLNTYPDVAGSAERRLERSVDAALRTLADRGLPAWVCGEAEVAGSEVGDRVVVEGRHPAR